MGQQMEYGMPAPNGVDMVGTNSLTTFKLSKKEKSLSAQAQWYVYSSMQISKSRVHVSLVQEDVAGGRGRAIHRHPDARDVEGLCEG